MRLSWSHRGSGADAIDGGYAGSEFAGDGADQLVHGSVSFHLHHLWDMDASGFADAGEIVTSKVDDHEIFGAIFFAASQRGAECGVFLGRAAAADGSFDGRDSTLPAVSMRRKRSGEEQAISISSRCRKRNAGRDSDGEGSHSR